MYVPGFELNVFFTVHSTQEDSPFSRDSSQTLRAMVTLSQYHYTSNNEKNGKEDGRDKHTRYKNIPISERLNTINHYHACSLTTTLICISWNPIASRINKIEKLYYYTVAQSIIISYLISREITKLRWCSGAKVFYAMAMVP